MNNTQKKFLSYIYKMVTHRHTYYLLFSPTSDLNSMNTNCFFEQCTKKLSLTPLVEEAAASLNTRTCSSRHKCLKCWPELSRFHLAKPPHIEMGNNLGQSH